MKYLLLCAPMLLAAAVPAQAVTTTYGNSAIFLAALTRSVTDDYGVASGYFGAAFQFLSDAGMSAVFGQTDYTATGFSNRNVVFNGTYCAGCNGSFNLGFLTMSYSNANGVFGVGFNVVLNVSALPYSALVTFGNNSQTLYSLPGPGGYFGITSTTRIKAIDFGPGGGVSRAGLFSIDNLSVGAVPEPASWAMLITGFGLIGAAARWRRTAVAA